ncbi:hypothetical protein Liucustia_83 [Acinetobacter phage Liucustia]|nr:hypothetical protein Liucustia_83 [Acinetobacter phage Liucustia]
MSLIGRWFKVVDDRKLDEFDIQNGDILKVQDEYKAEVWGYGATKVERVRGNDTQVLTLSRFSGYWCYFSESMIKKGELVEVQCYMQNVGNVEDTFKFGDLEPNVGGPCTLREVKLSGIGQIEDDVKEHVQSVVNKMNADLLMTLEERYNNWIVENIHVYELFCDFAIKAIQSGKKRISHWLIVNRLRWEVEIETKGTCYQDKDFKISNDYIAFLARDFMKDYPQYGEVFKIKQMKRV